MGNILNDNTTWGVEANKINANFEAAAIAELRLHDHSLNFALNFAGFADTGMATPAHTEGNAYKVTETGMVFGISATKGQWIVDDGASFTSNTLFTKDSANEELNKTKAFFGNYAVEYTDGTATSTTNYEAFYININSVRTIKAYLADIHNDRFAAIAFYQKDGTYMQSESVPLKNNTGSWYTAQVPEEAHYARLSNRKAILSESVILMSQRLNDFSDIDDLVNLSLINKDDGFALYYPSGRKQYNSSFSTTKYYRVAPQLKIDYKLSASSGFAVIAAYDKHFNILQSNSIEGQGWSTYLEGTWTPSADTFYVAFCFVTSSTYYDNYYLRSNIITDSINRDILYWNEEARLKVLNAERTEAIEGNFGSYPPLVLLHFSDIHSSGRELIRIQEFYNHHSDLIDDRIHTGDTLSVDFNSDFTFWTDNNADGILQVVGNHDRSNASDDQAVYDKLFAPFVSGWGVTQPTDAATLGLMYYYKDYTTQNVRLIVLDYINTSEQLSWLDSALSDANTNNMSVVIAIHYSAASLAGNTENTFTTLDMHSSTAYFSSSIKDKVEAFITAGGDFVTYIAGHQHRDMIGKIPGYPNQLMITIDAALCGSSYDRDTARKVGDKSQDLFNIMAIDASSKLLKIVRIGADHDRYLRKKSTLCYSYDTNELIFNG